jgi:hypothetical protein
MPELKRLPATRIVASPTALDAAQWPAESLVLRLAPDELLIIPALAQVTLADPHAIIIAEGGYAGVWLPAADALDFLERACEWEIPAQRPAFAQGAVAGIPAKLWLEAERVLIITPAPYAAEFEERMA